MTQRLISLLGLQWMPRWLLLGVRVLVSLACVFLAAMWARSYRVQEEVVLRRWHEYGIRSCAGTIYFERRTLFVFYRTGTRESAYSGAWEEKLAYRAEVDYHPVRYGRTFGGSLFDWPRAGVGWVDTTPWSINGNMTFKGESFVAPYWMVLTPLVLVGAAHFAWCWRHRPRAGQGLCRACGYDLRGTFAAGRKECPECGAGV